MRIIMGVLVFVVWSSLSTYWYVCKIKETCKDEKITKFEPLKHVIVKEIKPENTQVQFDFTTFNIYFPFAKIKANLSEELTDSIKLFSKKLISAKKIVLLTGNTDNIGSNLANQKLGLERANWVKNILILNGVKENNIKIKSLGESEPVKPNNNKNSRSKNRRVKISIQN